MEGTEQENQGNLWPGQNKKKGKEEEIKEG